MPFCEAVSREGDLRLFFFAAEESDRFACLDCVRIFMHARFSHARWSFPGPLNFFLSLQNTQWPQSTALHPAHTPQRARLERGFFPDDFCDLRFAFEEPGS